MAAHAAVRIDDDLPARHATVRRRAAFDELPGGIHENLDMRAEPFAEDFGAEAARDVIANLVLRDFGSVLRRHEHGLHARRLVLLVSNAHLGLGIRTEPVALAVFARRR